MLLVEQHRFGLFKDFLEDILDDLHRSWCKLMLENSVAMCSSVEDAKARRPVKGGEDVRNIMWERLEGEPTNSS